MAIYVKTGGIWKEPKTGFVKVNGVWTPILKIFENNNGTWKQVEPSVGSQSFTTVGTGFTFTVPPFVRQITVSASGGGGGGGYVYGNGDCRDQGGAGGGGSSGCAVVNQVLSVTPGSVLTINVGAGGGSGAAGQTTSITGYLVLPGGNPGGSGATCSYFTNGDFKGGGSSAGIGSNAGQSGYRTNGYQGGQGGSSPWGTGGLGGFGWGGRGENNGSPGLPGTGYGAAGGGGGENATYQPGGNGYQGFVTISW